MSNSETMVDTAPAPATPESEVKVAAGAHLTLVERLIMPTILIVVLFGLPWFHPGYRLLSLATSTGVSAIALYGLAILVGQAGIMSVGHAALMGVGAYTGAILSRDLGMNLWTALPFAAIFSALAAGLVGLPSLRVGGHHFVIITFAFCGLLAIVLTNGGAFTGAASGLDIGAIAPLFGVSFGKLQNVYLLVAFFVLASIALTWLVMVSRYGRTLRSIRENEKLASALGIDVRFHKIVAFMLSGAFAGVAGILQVYFLQHISPELFGAFPSVYIALMVMLGGPRMLYGPLAGALIVTFLPEVLNLDPIDARIAYGIGLIAVILLLPGGVMAGLASLYRTLRSKVARA
ncbi:branched-chain amino acid ABC transporter permease [Methylocapsa sp. S129]|uniref:branched-chain amino acid ABC transporter permease n=1 Tax=Methylocapsa sp. S129 TaxID=1641869 RepID=UPI001FEE7C52|nr:branched-chain amino acid ABC transporter permease [Methylocapsa sp. S129]